MPGKENKGAFVIKMIVTVIAATIIGFGIFAFMNFGNIAKMQAERIGSQTLGVPVTIGSLDISLAEKQVSVGKIAIGNPNGFKRPDALTVDDITVQLESLSKDLIVFKKIAVNSAQITFEANENGTNFSALKKNLPQSSAKEQKTAPAGNQIKVIVRDFQLNGAKIDPAVLMFDAAGIKPIAMPNIRLSGIGEKENGVLAKEAIAQIFNAISTKVNAVAGNAGFLKGLSPDTIKDIGVNPDQIKDTINNVTKNVEDIGDDIGKKVKGLFGN